VTARPSPSASPSNCRAASATKPRSSAAELAEFCELTQQLGPKLGPLLVQLPPSFSFEARVAGRFFTQLERLYSAEQLATLAQRLAHAAQRTGTRELYCIFDTTALGAAAVNALDLRQRLARA
jgi:uncharacterized protein YecE (DUF72 family)